MRRREFIAIAGGAIAAPMEAWAQSNEPAAGRKLRRRN